MTGIGAADPKLDAVADEVLPLMRSFACFSRSKYLA
jgi:hypothetical protein